MCDILMALALWLDLGDVVFTTTAAEARTISARLEAKDWVAWGQSLDPEEGATVSAWTITGYLRACRTAEVLPSALFDWSVHP